MKKLFALTALLGLSLGMFSAACLCPSPRLQRIESGTFEPKSLGGSDGLKNLQMFVDAEVETVVLQFEGEHGTVYRGYFERS